MQETLSDPAAAEEMARAAWRAGRNAAASMAAMAAKSAAMAADTVQDLRDAPAAAEARGRDSGGAPSARRCVCVYIHVCIYIYVYMYVCIERRQLRLDSGGAAVEFATRARRYVCT